MLDAHSELSELSAIAVDGFIYMTATHEDTLYSIERCYQSLNLAIMMRDLLSWIQKVIYCPGFKSWNNQTQLHKHPALVDMLIKETMASG